MSGSFSVIFTVKNEEKNLPKAIEYYKALGAKKIFVFWDGTTDNSPEIIKDDIIVLSQNSIHFEEFKELFGINYPKWFDTLIDNWDIKFDFRKRINTMYAAKLTRELGIEWMVSPDPDELIYFFEKEEFGPNQFQKILADTAPNIDQILLRNMEAVPTEVGKEHPFIDIKYFVNRFPITEFFNRAFKTILRFSKIPAGTIDLLDHYFFRARFQGLYPRPIINPLNGNKIHRSLYIGYRGYKPIIRVKDYQCFIFNTHYWQSNTKKIKSIIRGNILHYDICDSSEYKNKFKQRHIKTIDQGYNVRTYLGWIARKLDSDALADFFESQIVLKNKKILNLLVKKKILRQVNQISDFYRKK